MKDMLEVEFELKLLDKVHSSVAKVPTSNVPYVIGGAGAGLVLLVLVIAFVAIITLKRRG